MSLKMKRLFALLLCLSMIGALIVGCNGQPVGTSTGTTGSSTTTTGSTTGSGETTTTAAPAGDPVKLSMGAIGFSSSADDPLWPSMWMQKLQSDLNIELEFIGYDEEKANLALASGDLPDLMMINAKYVQQVLDADYAVAMDDYLEEFGPNIKSFNMRNDITRKFMSNGTNKLYFHRPNSGIEGATGYTELWNGYIVRWDLYKQIGAPKMANDDDYIAALNAMKAIYPKTENGSPVYGMGIHNDWGLWGWVIRSYSNLGYINLAHWGYASNSNTNEIVNNYLDYDTPSPFWNDMKFYNKMYLEGLLDPDSYTMKAEEVEDKAGKGQYLGGYCTWFLGNLYTNKRAEDPNTLAGFMAVPAEGQNGWYGQNSLTGWDGKDLFITTKCEDITTAVKFIDYLDSPDANRSHYSGIQGVHWDYNSEGNPEIFKSTLDLKANGGDEWTKTGIASFANFIGSAEFGVHPDGSYFTLFDDTAIKVQTLSPLQQDFSKFYNVEYPSQLHLNMVKAGKAVNQGNLIAAIQMGVSNIPSDVNRIDTKCDEIIIKSIPSLVQAKTEAEFTANRDQVIADLKSAGAEEAWNWWKTNWDESKVFFDELVKK